MRKPTTKDRINLRVWRYDGVIQIENIVGYLQYPIAIHRSIHEHQEIQDKQRKRHSSRWHVTHIPTGKSFGIQTGDWDLAFGYVKEIVDHPVLLMITDDTMSGHPMYQDLIKTHQEARKKWNVQPNGQILSTLFATPKQIGYNTYTDPNHRGAYV